MDTWVWLLLAAYLVIGLKKTGDKVASGMRGTSLMGTYIVGILGN